MLRLEVKRSASGGALLVSLFRLFLLLICYNQLKILITRLGTTTTTTSTSTSFTTNTNCPLTNNYNQFNSINTLPLLLAAECRPILSRNTQIQTKTNQTINTINYPTLPSSSSSSNHSTSSAGASRNLVLIQHQTEQPDFVEPIGNHTVAVGRDAQLACKISNLGNYRTAWLRVEDKGILTIHNNVITRNYRFGLMNNEDESSFVLTIRNVQPSDKGGYMCQINSVPMKYAVGYLDVLTPPVFDETGGQASSGGITNKNDGDAGSSPSESDPSSSSGNHDQEGSQQQQQMQQPANSSQVTVVEGSDATLTCLARGHPKPTITWRREDGRPIIVNGNELVGSTASDLLANAPTEIKDTTTLSFVSVNRFNSGAYLCIASNGVQPSASKRQLLDVQYSSTITVPETEISGWLGEHEAQLECYADSNPGGSYHWVKLATSTTNTDRRPMVANQEDDLWLIEHDELMPSDKFDIVIKQINSEKVRMILIIRQVEKQDFSWYKCIAKNSLGLQSNFVRFYEAPMGQQQHQTPAAAATTTTTTASSSFSFKNIIRFNDFIGGGSSSGSSSQTTGQQQQQDDNKLNLPQNDDSRLSFQRSSSSSSSARSAGSVSPISQLLLHYTTAPLHLGSSVTLQSYLLYHCQFAALFSLVMITTLLNLLSATTGITRLQALDPQQQQQQT